jgi:hypothetical protein
LLASKCQSGALKEKGMGKASDARRKNKRAAMQAKQDAEDGLFAPALQDMSLSEYERHLIKRKQILTRKQIDELMGQTEVGQTGNTGDPWFDELDKTDKDSDPFVMGFRGWLGWEVPTTIKIQIGKQKLSKLEAKPQSKKRDDKIAEMKHYLLSIRNGKITRLVEKARRRRAALSKARVDAVAAGIRLPHDPTSGKLMKQWADIPAYEPEPLTPTEQVLRAMPMPPLVVSALPPQAELDRPERVAFVVAPDYLPGHAFEPAGPRPRILKVVDGRMRQIATRYKGGAAGLPYHEKYMDKYAKRNEAAEVVTSAF